MYGFRNTFIRDSQGEPCLKTWSMGAFVDLSTGKLKRIDDATISSISIDLKQEMNYRDRRIILPKEGGTPLSPIRVLRADIDYNRHMNNANYVRVAMELLPDDFLVKGLRVEYRIAAKLGDVLRPLVLNHQSSVITVFMLSGMPAAIIEFSR